LSRGLNITGRAAGDDGYLVSPNSSAINGWADGGPGRRPAHERLRALAINKLPQIEALIGRATTIRQLLITCAACECDSLDECEILEESIAAIPDRPPGRPPAADHNEARQSGSICQVGRSARASR
jgi:hypothetical protein